jgi:hypothetical protein
MTNLFGTPLLAVIVCAATLTACSHKSAEPSSQPARSSPAATPTAQTSTPGGTARAEMSLNGHTHTIAGPVNCTAQAANPGGTPPLGNLAIGASDDTASFVMSWLSNTPSPLMALTFTYKIDGGQYAMPYYPRPPKVQANAQGNSYMVKGDAPVLVPGESTVTKNMPVEIHATCP